MVMNNVINEMKVVIVSHRREESKRAGNDSTAIIMYLFAIYLFSFLHFSLLARSSAAPNTNKTILTT